MRIGISSEKGLFLQGEMNLSQMERNAHYRDHNGAAAGVNSDNRIQHAVVAIHNRLLLGKRLITDDYALLIELASYFLVKRCRSEDLLRVENGGGGYVLLFAEEANVTIQEHQREQGYQDNTKELYSTSYTVGFRR